VRLYELAYCCRLFGTLDAFDRATVELQASTGPFVDPGRTDHHAPLFRWLRRWGCRHMAVRDEQLASESLSGWWSDWVDALPQATESLSTLDDQAVDAIAAAYDDLRLRPASWQERAGGRVHRGFGPAGASKAMYAIRPNACAPWDVPIRRHFGLGIQAEDYRRRLTQIRDELSELAEDLDQGTAVSDLPRLLERPRSSPVKLVDEHDWVRYTRGFDPPPAETLEQWGHWSRM
jgi:hypothetical protein